MWTELCLNPYENKVQENENGKRRVQISGGWLEEDKVEAIKVCRVSSTYDVEIAANSMSVPAISKSFNHDPAMAYAIWSAKRNIKTDVSPLLLSSEAFFSNKSYRSFKRKVGMSLGKKAITVWASNMGWSNNVARWDVVVKAPSPTLTRGAQIGLARGIQRFSGKWIEMGLLDSIDSSTWRLSAKNRMIWAAEHNDHPLAPQTYKMQSWLMPPVAKTITKKNTFNPLGKEAKEKPKNSKVLAVAGQELWNTDDGINRVLWCTASSLHKFGADGLNAWWEWFARIGKGVVVFDKTDTPEQRSLFALLKKENKNYQRWVIQDEQQNTKFVVWWIDLFKDKIASKTVLLSDWVGEAPKKRPNESLNVEDEFGRVRYRALSKLNKSEGMAPKRLEQSMNKALVELSHTKKDVDAVISNLLNIDRKFLPDSLSAEQVDAISLAISAFEKNAGMILADETGFGKGRILAALAIIGLKLGKTVLFFTEKSQLFTDFFRDITDVVNLDKVDIMPTVLHGSAKVYDQQGNVIKKALSKTNFDKMLNTPEWEEKEDKLILSTYSQINRPGKGNAKIKWLVDRVKDGECWLLLDEAHNAAGDSNISENLNTLLTYTEGVLYSSATFAKSEQNLSLYKKALAVEEWLYGLIESTMISDDGALREALTTSMASRGSFIRREHPPVPPPKPVWIDMTDERREAYRNFSIMWRCIHEATQKWEVAMGNHSSAAWMKVGSILSRSVKEFSLLMKCDSLIQEVEDVVNSNKKAVIVVQSTFESALKSLLGEMDDDEEEEEIIDAESGEENSKKKKKSIPTNVELDHIPLWKERMLSILNQVAPQDDLVSMGVDEEGDAAMAAYTRALEAISKMPDWDLMPFEKIKNTLAAKGIEVGELSGRTLTVSQTPNGKWIIHSRKIEPRTETVRRFNNGELNVIIVTLAGCSGISLHAGKKFKDQRQRVLIEADIAPNPANRIQFWGRVRRKDQVCEPLYFSLMFYMPAEIRIMSKEDSKREKLAAHVGMKQETKEVGWITEEGETIVAEWALERPEAAKFIGVAYPVLDNPIGRVDKALARLIVMEDYEQEAFLSRLERGLKLAEDVSFKDKSSANIKQSRIVRRGWLWGHPERSEDSERGEKGPLAMPRIDYVERVIEKNVQPNYDDITETLKLRKQDADFAYYEGLSVLDRWSDSWAEEAKAGVPTTAYRRSVWDWVSRVLPSSLCGNAVRVSRPGTGEPVWGMILGVYAPEKGGRIKGASPWALSQVGLEVWLIGENEPLIISLARCYSDANFMVNGEKAVASWFKAEVVSHTCITIEGNPLLSAAWGKKWGAGRPTLINDDEKGISWVWMLPGSWTWDVMKTLPKDLIDVDHTMKFLYDNPGAPVYAAVRTGKLFKLIPKEGAVILQMDREMDNFSKETWINFKNKQSMKNEVWRNGVVERTIDWKSIIYILYAMDKVGIKWRVDAEHEAWYYRTSKQVMEGIIKSKSKALTGAVKKQFSNKQKSFSK